MDYGDELSCAWESEEHIVAIAPVSKSHGIQSVQRMVAGALLSQLSRKGDGLICTRKQLPGRQNVEVDHRATDTGWASGQLHGFRRTVLV
jgi:hypothetical protein